MKCPWCPVTFALIEEMAVHLASAHRDNTRASTPAMIPLNVVGIIKCDICEESFNTFPAYSRHFDSRHINGNQKVIERDSDGTTINSYPFLAPR